MFFTYDSSDQFFDVNQCRSFFCAVSIKLKLDMGANQRRECFRDPQVDYGSTVTS